MDIKSGIELAIKNEVDGIEFYRKAKAKTNHPFGKAMFEAFMQDEKEHLELLKKTRKGAGPLKIDIDRLKGKKAPRKHVKGLFETMKNAVEGRLEANPDELEALRIAMEIEEKGFKLYQQLSQQASNDEEKAFFEFLVGEEKQHFQLLQNTYIYLEDSGNWFLWEERGLLDGG
jgi:rubrerythrin